EIDRDRIPPHPWGKPWPPTGGAADYLRFLERDVPDAVSRLAPLDDARRTLFGHSLGGLLAILALLWGGAGFTRFLGASPALWFAPDAVDAACRSFSVPERAGLGLLALVGSEEEPAAAVDPRS